MRHCLSEPIPEIWDAARLLDEAAIAHLNKNAVLAEELIKRVNYPEIRRWLKGMWANSSVHLQVAVPKPQSINKELRSKPHLPTPSVKAIIHERDGYNCRFCGMPVIRPETRTVIKSLYPNALCWGRKEPVATSIDLDN